MTAPIRLMTTKNITRVEWLKGRQAGYGGSDIAALMDYSPYADSTRTKVWCDKVMPLGDFDDFEPDHIRMGRLMEDVIAQEWANRTGHQIRKRHCIFQHPDPKHSIALANIDRDVVGEKSGLEVKRVGSHMLEGWGKAHTGEVPADVRAQCLWYCEVMGWDRCYVGRETNSAMVPYVVTAEPATQEHMLEVVHDFNDRYVVPKIRPKDDRISDKDLKRLFPEAGPGVLRVEPGDPLVDEYRMLHQAKVAKAEAEALYKARVVHMKKQLGEACQLVVDGELKPLVTWNNTRNGTLDLSALYGANPELVEQYHTLFDEPTFRKDHPDLYAQHVVASPRRTFLPKTVKSVLEGDN